MKRPVSILIALLLALSPSVVLMEGIGLESMTVDQLVQLRADVNAALMSSIISRMPQDDASGPIGSCYVAIKNARLAESYDGKDCIVVLYEWAHTKDEAETFMFALMYPAFQDGIELDYNYDSSMLDMDTSLTEIKAGEVLEVEMAYELRDTTSPVEIEVTELFNWNSADKVEKTFSFPL